jgi:hypothetical protein
MQIPVGFDYVLIIEWLAADDAPTGSQLHQYLQHAGIPSVFALCNSWDQICETLSTAASEVSTRGVPVIRLETHGSNPWEGREEDIGFGTDQASLVPWARRPANRNPSIQAISSFCLPEKPLHCDATKVVE